MLRFCFTFLTLLLPFILLAQEPVDWKPLPYLQAELRVGETLPASTQASPSKPQVHGQFAWGKYHYEPDESQAVFLNYPFFGVSFTYTDFGNSDYLGYGLSLMPFMEVNLIPNTRHALYLKVLSGASYISRVYHAEDNRGNLATGSHLNWNFETFLQYKVLSGRKGDLKLGLGFSHHSNGHTQLPNLGQNSLLLSMGYGIRLRPSQWEPVEKRMPKPRSPKTRQLFLAIRTGLGLHEFGGTTLPIGGPDKLVWNTELDFGIILKNAIAIRAVLGYRFYEAYYDHIEENQTDPYTEQQYWNSSNVNLGFGVELLFGHIGVDLNVGVNLFKPYYEVHYDLYEAIVDKENIYGIKQTMKASAGVKVYAISTRKQSRHNAFTSFRINTNYGQADFLDVTLGYMARLGKGWVRQNGG